MSIKDLRVNFPACLVGLTFGLAFLEQSFASALIFTVAVAYMGLCRWLEPAPVKPATQEDLESFKEEMKNLRSEIGLVKTSLGLSTSGRPGRSKISVFPKT